MTRFAADPAWGWWIVGYFFLGGIAAGAYFAATLIEAIGRDEDRPVARAGYRLALPLIAVCGIFLILDLDRPERFWHMMFQSEVVHHATGSRQTQPPTAVGGVPDVHRLVKIRDAGADVSGDDADSGPLVAVDGRDDDLAAPGEPHDVAGDL